MHASQIRKANGVYLLGQLLLKAPRRSPDDPDAEADGGEAAPLVGDASAGLLLCSSKRDHEDEASASCGSSHESMAAHAFRTLRFVFSTERNRKLFRRLFPPDLYASFIDVGQYERDLQRRAQPASVSVAHPLFTLAGPSCRGLQVHDARAPARSARSRGASKGARGAEGQCERPIEP